MKPGEGFKRGNLVSFMAIQHPLPEHAKVGLQRAAAQCREYRLKLEASPSSKVLRQDYADAVRDLEVVENMLRSSHGVQETRPEFISFSALRMIGYVS